MIPLLFRALMLAAHTRRGRRLMFLGARHATRLARSPQARRAYARAWRIASDPRPRRAAVKFGRSAATRVPSALPARVRQLRR